MNFEEFGKEHGRSRLTDKEIPRIMHAPIDRQPSTKPRAATSDSAHRAIIWRRFDFARISGRSL